MASIGVQDLGEYRRKASMVLLMVGYAKWDDGGQLRVYTLRPAISKRLCPEVPTFYFSNFYYYNR